MGANIVRQSKIPLGLRHVASIEVQRCETIITWKELLWLARFARHLNCLIVAAGRKFRLAMALMNLSEHNQWNSEMLALIECTVEFDGLFGSRHAFVGTSVRESATGDSEIGKKARLKAEIADTARDIKAAPAYLHCLCRIDHRVEHTKIRVTATGCAEEASGFGDCEDYALEKRRELMNIGVPAGDLLMTVARQPNGDGHAVLTVRTSLGEFILDNLQPKVLSWNDTDYTYLKRQSTENSGVWVTINDGREDAVASVR